MSTLKNLSSEYIRKNWTDYKDTIQNTPYYEVLWDDWKEKFNCIQSDEYLEILIGFINGDKIDVDKIDVDKMLSNGIKIDNNDILILEELDSDERKYIHMLCDNIGLHHVSKNNSAKKFQRNLYIYKPKVWLWEYTENNPYQKNNKFNKKINKQQKLSRKYCCICERNGLEVELFCSIFIRGLYCSECLDETSDGEGGVLSGHKFEPLYI